MKRIGTALALFAVLMMGTGCGGGSDDPVDALGQLTNCTGDGIAFLTGLIATAGVLGELIEDDAQQNPAITITEVVGNPLAFDYEIQLDIDGDGLNETTITGRATFSEDPTDGIANGATAVVTFNISGTEDRAGGGTLNLEFGSGDELSVYGAGSLDLDGDCEFDFNIDQNTALTFGFSGGIPAISLGGAQLFGVIGVATSVGANDLEASVTLAQNSNDITASGVSLNGAPVEDFNFSLPIDEETVFGLLFCSILQVEGAFSLIDEILDALEAEITDGTYENGTATFTPTGLTSFSFSITFNGNEVFEDGDTVMGTVTLNAIPAPNSTITATITFDSSLTVESDVSAFSVSTSQSAPLVVTIALGQTLDVLNGELYGTINSSLTGDSEGESCTGRITIPQETALEFDIDEEDDDGIFDELEGGALTILTDLDGDTLRFSLGVVDGFDVLLIAYVNGIPIPGELIFGFLN
ncbi:MAG: hypothetical protein AAGD14_00840 [Planctomycetota bacterium]